MIGRQPRRHRGHRRRPSTRTIAACRRRASKRGVVRIDAPADRDPLSLRPVPRVDLGARAAGNDRVSAAAGLAAHAGDSRAAERRALDAHGAAPTNGSACAPSATAIRRGRSPGKPTHAARRCSSRNTARIGSELRVFDFRALQRSRHRGAPRAARALGRGRGSTRRALRAHRSRANRSMPDHGPQHRHRCLTALALCTASSGTRMAKRASISVATPLALAWATGAVLGGRRCCTSITCRCGPPPP